uniref:Putative basic tail protein n=1 Tax=Ixodes ricinus TaxID=34613 RepID=A0A0K8RGW2_IXORI
MPASRLLIVTIACLAGQITCAELDPNLKRCEDIAFDDPGYSLGCTYACKNGKLDDETEYWGNYEDATVCVVLKNDDFDANHFDHIGTCKNGSCVEYKEENIQEVWSQLPQTQAQFHYCDPKSSEDAVDNCLYICEKEYQGKWGYFFGIYLDYNKCKIQRWGTDQIDKKGRN